MKKIKQIGTIAFLALAFTFTSCSSDSDGSSTGGLTGGLATTGTIKGNVDGTTIITDLNTTSGTIMGTGSFRKLQVLGVYSSTGADGSIISEGFGVTVFGYTDVGTYNINMSEGSDISLSFNRIITKTGEETTSDLWAAGKIFAGSTATVTITEASSTRVIGTFSLKGLGNNGIFKEVTNGSFNVAVTEYNQSN